MNLEKYKFFIFIFIISIFSLNISEIKIILKIDNNIITNVDLENEINYLKIQNPTIKKLSINELRNLSKNSLIRQIIKKSETNKYFLIENNLKLGETLVKEDYLRQGFNDKNDFKIYLKDKNLHYEVYREKLMIERFWNSLIYEKFKDKIKIDENKIRQKLIEYKDREKINYEYYLSEILFDFETNLKTLQNYIKNNGFEAAAAKFSISNTSINGGKIGWVKISSLTDELKKEINNLSKNEISTPIKISNGNLIIKVNDIRKLENKFNLNDELKKQINFEQNRQLNNFSLNFFKKLKQNIIINEY